MTTEIIARLQLRAEQFSSDGGKAFASLATSARTAASQVRSEFTGAFAEVQKLAQTALVLPRNATGSLDLSQEIAQLNVSANAAEQKAQALRELSIAQTSASNAVGVDTQAMRLEADAAAVAALAEERNAQAIRGRIVALEAVQSELNQTTSATRLLTAAEEEQASAATRAKGSFVNLGQQAIDFTVQIKSGQSALIAFTQQLPQAAYAMTQLEGRGKAIGTFLTGPWGIALTIGTLALAPFVAELWDNSKAAEAAKKATDDLGSTVGNLGTFFDLATGKIKETNAALLQYAILSRDKEIQDERGVQASARSAGRDALVASQRSTSQYGGAYLPGSGGGSIQTTIGSDEVAKVFANGPNAPGIDAALRKIAASGSGSSAYAEKILQQRAVFYQSADKIAKLDREKLSLTSGVLDPSFRTGASTKSAVSAKPKDFSRPDDSAEQLIAGINAEWDDQPRLIDKARTETLKLDNLIAQLQKRKLTPEVEKLIASAGDAKQAIQDGLNRPFEEFVRAQRESLAVGQLTLQGRDVDAEALSNALRIQQQQGYVSQSQLETVHQLADEHQRITQALEDQRRVVGIYDRAFSGVVDQADRLFAKIQGQSGGIIGVVQTLQRDLFTNSIFGNVPEAIEKEIRRITGKQTPAEIIQVQAADAGKALRVSAADFTHAADEFTRGFRGLTAAINGTGFANGASAEAAGVGAGIARLLPKGANDNADYANQDIVVRGQVHELLTASGVLGVAIDQMATNFHKLGFDVPKAITDGLKKDLPTVLGGITGGQFGGSVFASITGGKDDKLASSIGGTLGNIAGKELGKLVPQAATGLLKTLGGAAGPIGSILGGVLGNVIGGLFHQSSYGTAFLTDASTKVTASGRGGDNIGAATGLAGSVQQGLRQIADQLGATVGAFDTVVGTFDGKYRVRTTASGWDGKGALDYNGKSGNNLYDFGDDQAAALAFAIADAVKDGAIKGLSAASQRLLTGSSDLDAAIGKVTLIESIPKSLKAMLDPVGAAVDDLNRQWAKTKAALDEGGASAEQMAQAQQLYNLQLQQTLNSTASASQTLKDFRDSLNIGSSSPYSLRDQETAALAKLQPFLDQINAGKAVDQEKYATAANAAIDIERQIYGSTQGFFTFFDNIQAATNKAISSIDNAVPVSAGVDSPFAKATADSAAATATNTKTTNELLAQVSDLMARNNQLLAQYGGATDGAGKFFTDRRLFVAS